MANSDKNIVITPNRGLSGQPEIAFTGFGNSSISIKVPDDTTGKLSFENSSTTLFSSDSNLTSGPLFSVSDVNGIPILETTSNSIDIGSKSSDVTIGGDGIQLPSYSTSGLPANEEGLVVFDETTSIPKYNNGSRWVPLGFRKNGETADNAGDSAKQVWRDYPNSLSGLYYINTPNNGIMPVYCDMDTKDEYGESGWMLVASWQTGSTWRNTWPTTREVVQTPNLNKWSANFGDSLINQFRITASGTLNPYEFSYNYGADWYYYWTTAVTWKSVWAWQQGANNNWINDSTGDSRGNINAFSGWPAPVNAGNAAPRICLRGFDWAYNIKWQYKASTQRWCNLSDYAAQGTSQTHADFWTGLTIAGQNGLNLASGIAGLDDGTLGIIPEGDTSTTAAHDCNNNNAKVGIDDTGVCYYYGQSPTANMATNVSNTGTDYPLQFWIR